MLIAQLGLNDNITYGRFTIFIAAELIILVLQFYRNRNLYNHLDVELFNSHVVSQPTGPII